MGEHKFKLYEEDSRGKIYLVKCKNTTGEFSTELWRRGFEQQNICPCCKELIEKRDTSKSIVLKR